MPPRRSPRLLATYKATLPAFPPEVLTLIITHYLTAHQTDKKLKIIPLLLSARSVKDLVLQELYREVVLESPRQCEAFLKNAGEGLGWMKYLKMGFDVEGQRYIFGRKGGSGGKGGAVFGGEGGRLDGLGLTKELDTTGKRSRNAAPYSWIDKSFSPRTIRLHSTSTSLSSDLETFISLSLTRPPPAQIEWIGALSDLSTLSLQTYLSRFDKRSTPLLPPLVIKIVDRHLFRTVTETIETLCGCGGEHYSDEEVYPRVPPRSLPEERTTYRRVLKRLGELVEKNIVPRLEINMYLVTADIKAIVLDWARERERVTVGCDRSVDEMEGVEALTGLDISTVPM